MRLVAMIVGALVMVLAAIPAVAAFIATVVAVEFGIPHPLTYLIPEILICYRVPDYLRELSTPVIGAPARRVVPKCKGSSEANSSW